MSIRSILKLWFSFDLTVDRRTFLISGLILGVIKYAGDAGMLYSYSGNLWHVWDYLSPKSILGVSKTGGNSADSLLIAFAAWALPFVWIGVSLTMRRALDAGWSAWMALFFFVPLMNYVLFFFLSIMPTVTAEARASAQADSSPIDSTLPRALRGVGAAVAIGSGMLIVSVYLLDSYGGALFLGTPFIMGAVSAFLYNRPPASVRATLQVMLLAQCIVAGILVLTAAEGFLCLLMAMPITLAVGVMGANMGRHIATRDPRSPSHAYIGVLLLPLAASVESLTAPSASELALREVRSSVIINAPASVVWRNVIAFPPMAEPTDWLFKSGIAYPLRAEIRGEGVGAIRYCVFSTGAFVEPITHWEPGVRLSFSVDSQPRPLHEWSPYANVAPPHLDSYLVSRRGEFRLVALSATQTRLEGSTWYEMRMAPRAYWVIFGDLIIHRIHSRVLDHIKATAERGAVADGSARRLGR